MKMLVAMLLFVGNAAFASEMSVEKREEIIKSVQQFDEECPEFAKNKTISAVNVKNKTSEHIDKKEMSKFIAEHFDVSIDPKSSYVLDSVLSSKSTTKDKVTKTTYTFNFKLTDKKKVLCDKSYSSEFTE